ncbi:MAG: WecB/TagA/CpsF family glycosyltransferase [Carnobacterium sp.]|uniref:WecB/TagA/CpsF family glycosyltransferase n=1 Tax=Carnobacterium sp. TaxID=48221 RepID=UPI003C758A05
MTKKKIDILHVLFDNLTQKEMLNTLINRVIEGKKTFVVTANPEIVMYANNNKEYMQLLHQANFITADGIGIVKGSNIMGTPIVERVAGYDLMLDLFKEAHVLGKSIYLLGAKQEVIEAAVKKIKKELPGIKLAGYNNGYFELSDDVILHNVLNSNADLIFVGIGFPKQEIWIERYLQQAEKGLVMGVGGAFDAYTGKVKRAPAIFIKMNLEWLYRLVRQPSRFMRMLVIPKFLMAVYEEKKKQQKIN